MLDYQKRVVEERDELVSKLDRLKTFINSNNDFKDLPQEEQSLLMQQRAAMEGYAQILTARISIFPTPAQEIEKLHAEKKQAAEKQAADAAAKAADAEKAKETKK